eukprot:GFUD01042972.1.p1 GENE.GFUD01042972.1~~GFUD01042972.1.p1  ORF type:complete len:293 (-),score=103.66 GFUD01042972.1:85-963(-)
MTSISIPPPPSFTLLVQGRLIHCSRRVIASSSLFMDMVELVEEDTSPIPIPTFISRQIMLDLVEMVEKGDWECAHLILVSLSYLLDFLIAADFLGCERLKSVLEEKVKDKLCDSNWREVFYYTKNILGLDNTIKHTMGHVCTRLVELAGEKDSLPMECDPYQQEYVQFTPDILKLILKHKYLGNSLRFCILRNWVSGNSEEKEEIFEMLLLVQFKEIEDSKVEEILNEVETWDIGNENLESFNKVIENAKKERELESLMRKKFSNKLQCQGHHLNHDMFFEIPGGPDVFFEM